MDDKARSETERLIAATYASIRRSEVHIARLQREQAEVEAFIEAARRDIALWRRMLGERQNANQGDRGPG